VQVTCNMNHQGAASTGDRVWCLWLPCWMFDNLQMRSSQVTDTEGSSFPLRPQSSLYFHKHPKCDLTSAFSYPRSSLLLKDRHCELVNFVRYSCQNYLDCLINLQIGSSQVWSVSLVCWWSSEASVFVSWRCGRPEPTSTTTSASCVKTATF